MKNMSEFTKMDKLVAEALFAKGYRYVACDFFGEISAYKEMPEPFEGVWDGPDSMFVCTQLIHLFDSMRGWSSEGEGVLELKKVLDCHEFMDESPEEWFQLNVSDTCQKWYVSGNFVIEETREEIPCIDAKDAGIGIPTGRFITIRHEERLFDIRLFPFGELMTGFSSAR